MKDEGEREGDREWARLFAEAREADESAAPAFREVLARRPLARRKPSVFLAAAAAAAAVLLAAAAGLLLTQGTVSNESAPHSASSSTRAPSSDLPPAAVAIAEWKSPTGFLLDTPGVDLLRERPAMGFASAVSRVETPLPSSTPQTK